MLGNYITVDGVSSRTLGLFCKQLPMFPVAVRGFNATTVGGRLDDIYQSANHFGDIQLDIEAVLIGFDMDPVIRYFTAGKKLVFSNIPDRYAVIRQLVAIDQQRVGNGALELKITLKCSPFKYSTANTPKEYYASPGYFKTVGTIYSEPLIIAKGCWPGFAFSLNGTAITTNGLDSISELVGPGKNLCPNGIENGAYSRGVTASVGADGSVTLSGTADSNGDPAFVLFPNTTWPAGTYHVSGCPAGGATAKYRIDVVAGGTAYRDTGSGVNFTLASDATVMAQIVVYRGKATPTDPFYPMICKKSNYDADPTYEPYGAVDLYFDVQNRVVYTLVNGEKTVVQEHTSGNIWDLLLVPSDTEYNELIFANASKMSITPNERWL
jgi:phage-related protein